MQRRAKTDSARERLVFLYPRQSRAMEEGEEPIEIQEERLRSWILTAITESNADPIRPAIRLVGCEGDLDVSGRTRLLDRPVGRRLAEMITRGEVTEVWVRDLGRLARNSTSWHQIKAFFEHYNIGILAQAVSSNWQEPVDTRSTTGKLILGILAWLQEWELDTINDRMNGNKRYKVQNDDRPVWRYGALPIGFSTNESNLLTPDTRVFPFNPEIVDEKKRKGVVRYAFIPESLESARGFVPCEIVAEAIHRVASTWREGVAPESSFSIARDFRRRGMWSYVGYSGQNSRAKQRVRLLYERGITDHSIRRWVHDTPQQQQADGRIQMVAKRHDVLRLRAVPPACRTVHCLRSQEWHRDALPTAPTARTALTHCPKRPAFHAVNAASSTCARMRWTAWSWMRLRST